MVGAILEFVAQRAQGGMLGDQAGDVGFARQPPRSGDACSVAVLAVDHPDLLVARDAGVCGWGR
jgi:hypothetical protein